MKFRKDINGLRALAVIAVVLFHFNASWMPGGFAGVDVFFVISGFLMTGIIFRGMDQDNFSVFNFYVARANRIIPALALLCLVLLVFGWFYLTPLEYKALGKHAASSVSFLSNFVYWQEAGYFDAASHEKWLLHTWSLSVEWQFYIIYPLVLLALRRFLSIKTLKLLLIVGTVLGFIFSAIATYKSPDAAYYLFPTRAWEMMLGGIAYLYPFTLQENRKKLVEWIGLILIITSYFLISAENLWPGYLAIFPVVGSFLVIQAQRNDSLITSNIVFQKLGAWSYSIYLWHWPFVVVIYKFSLPDYYIYIGMVLSILLGFLSYKYVEKINFPRSFPTLLSYLKCKPVYIALIVGALGSAIFIKNDTIRFYQMSSQQIAFIDSMVRGDYECFDKPYQHNSENEFCTITNGTKNILAFGDSHSYSLLPAVEQLARDNKLQLTYTGYSGCLPLINTYVKRNDQEEKSCDELNNKIKKTIMTGVYDYVLLSARWTYYTEGDYKGDDMQFAYTEANKNISQENSIKAFKSGIRDTFKEYSKSKSQIYIMLQIPLQEKQPDEILFNSSKNKVTNIKALNGNSVSTDKHNQFQKMTNDIIKKEANLFENITVIDPTATMCNKNNCPVGNEQTSYYFDDDHLSVSGNLKLKNFLEYNILSKY
ncbi:acyltransferase family protein [uncultured Psychrobacter sp.]|uniref:acyltransferase family protein n=1 Tax=uncultured Psychrobacter sp. TaxID=259303 RepID=UPI0026327276|nr:acyltransferase family protein [uncultured Psychrobacter sp.]